MFKTRDGKGNEGKRKRERETGAKERASDRNCYRIARVLHPSGNKTANACVEAGPDAFPQLHMLRHSLDFAERHRFLGRASEA